MGSWNCSFILGWDYPLGDHIGWDTEKGRYIVRVSIMIFFEGSMVEDAEVKVILPEART
jgi:hypothetical protein